MVCMFKTTVEALKKMSSVVCITVSGCDDREHLSLEDLVSFGIALTKSIGNRERETIEICSLIFTVADMILLTM